MPNVYLGFWQVVEIVSLPHHAVSTTWQNPKLTRDNFF